MELNSLVFPAPTSSYQNSDFKEELIWIPRNFRRANDSITKKIDSYKVKATILSEKEAKSMLNTRDLTITKKFDNCKVQASILSKPPNPSVKPISKTIDSVSVQANITEEISPEFENKVLCSQIPCLFTHYANTNKLMLYFHGNAEDIGISNEFVEMLSKNLHMNAISVEYPGYGVYRGSPSAEQIIIDSEIVYDYLTLYLQIKQENIIIFGRSIGSGPATHLAAHRKPGGLILMSPYTSIRDVVKEIVGSWGQYLVAERFKNLEKIKKVCCHTMFLHGKKDKLISCSHSEKMKSEMEKCINEKNIKIESHFGEFMTHNDFHFIHDLIKPLKDFFKRSGIDIKNENYDLYSELPRSLFENSDNFVNKKKSLITYFYEKLN